jgi:hypothetical protein
MTMSVGLIRTVLIENRNLVVEVLDLDSGAKPPIRVSFSNGSSVYAWDMQTHIWP